MEFINAKNSEIIGFGKITSLNEKKISEMREEDCDGHEQFKDTEEIIKNLRKYYGDVVDGNSIVKIIHFSFKKV